MKISKHVTITSKNQITIPADFVKSLQLYQDRTMIATLKDDSIILTPTKDLSDDMQKYWDKRRKKAKHSEQQLKNATRSIVAKKAAER